MTTAGCTIVSLNYLAFARTLAQSLLEIHPDLKLYVLVVDRLAPGEQLAQEVFDIVMVEELGIPDFPTVSFKYDVLELNTNVKPTFMKYLLSLGYERVIYFDPDIEVHAPLDPIFEALKNDSVVVTPHAISPITGDSGQEVHLLATGTYNLGFIAVKRDSAALEMLDWWENRCLQLAFDERGSGLFVDQKWMNLAVCYFNGISVLKHPGCNVAYWNLHERSLSMQGDRWIVNDTFPLIFYHFSGISLSGNRVSKYTDLYSLDNRPDLRQLFADYRVRLKANGGADQSNRPYAFGRFSNGELISPLLRSVYAGLMGRFSGSDPFDAAGPVYRWAKSAGLLRHRKADPPKHVRTGDWREDRRVTAVNLLLRSVAKLIGVDRYLNLLKYLSYVSILRNQQDIFKSYSNF